jgi:hypothetical protein
VLVENGSFLEPSYVIIDGLPEDIDIMAMR